MARHLFAALARLSFLGLVFGFIEAHAQEAPQVAGQSVEVLDAQEYILEERSIIYHRIKPPVLQAPVEPVALSAAKPSKPQLSPELLAAQEQRSQKEYFAPFIDIKVVDGISEISWRDETGEFVVWSSMDARVFWATSWFETEQVNFNIIGSISDETAAEVAAWNAYVKAHNGPNEELRSIPSLTAAERYRIISSPTEASPGHVEKIMNAWHGHYEANEAALLKAYQELIAANEALEKERLENPPQKEDTIIRYFPIRSNAKLEPSQ